MNRADDDARVAAGLLAIAPHTLRGVVLRASSRDQCDAWIAASASLLPSDAPVRRVPANITDDRLLGGLDFAATMATGKPVMEPGVLALADGGYLLLPGTTTRRATWMHVARALDERCVQVQRDGVCDTRPAGFAAIAVETPDVDPVPAAFSDRVALMLDLSETSRALWSEPLSRSAALRARVRLAMVETPPELLTALCTGAARLGVTSTRMILLALATTRASAALGGRRIADATDLACAARLVFSLRATETGESASEPPDAMPEAGDETLPQRDSSHQDISSESERMADDDPQGAPPDANELAAIVVRASRSALPAGLLVATAARAAHATAGTGRAEAQQASSNRGRQVGTRRGDPRGGARLDIVATLRAAVPMQRVRRATRASGTQRMVELRRDDMRVRRCTTPSATTTLFVVDASGSAALNRLAEVKGAVELMLAEGYARRNRVALVAFRGTGAELVLAPTHALARARRAIAGMPAGGGTPLASALDLVSSLVPSFRRDASQVVMVLLTDGRANVARDGAGGRARAEADAMDAARRLGALNCSVVWVDSADRPEPFARRVSDALGARYLPLPRANARSLSAAATGAGAGAGGGAGAGAQAAGT